MDKVVESTFEETHATTNIKPKFESKYTVLTRKLNNVIYELLVKTHSDMVYTSDTVTLTETLAEIFELITTNKKDITNIREKYDELVADAPDTFNSFKEIWDYVNVNGDPESELIKMIKGKQDAEEGKGLSTNDFTDILYEKLVNGYSKEQLIEMFNVVSKRQDTTDESISALEQRISAIEHTTNIAMGSSETAPSYVKDGDSWFFIISKDETKDVVLQSFSF